MGVESQTIWNNFHSTNSGTPFSYMSGLLTTYILLLTPHPPTPQKKEKKEEDKKNNNEKHTIERRGVSSLEATLIQRWDTIGNRDGCSRRRLIVVAVEARFTLWWKCGNVWVAGVRVIGWKAGCGGCEAGKWAHYRGSHQTLGSLLKHTTIHNTYKTKHKRFNKNNHETLTACNMMCNIIIFGISWPDPQNPRTPDPLQLQACLTSSCMPLALRPW